MIQHGSSVSSVLLHIADAYLLLPKSTCSRFAGRGLFDQQGEIVRLCGSNLMGRKEIKRCKNKLQHLQPFSVEPWDIVGPKITATPTGPPQRTTETTTTSKRTVHRQEALNSFRGRKPMHKIQATVAMEQLRVRLNMIKTAAAGTCLGRRINAMSSHQDLKIPQTYGTKTSEQTCKNLPTDRPKRPSR